MWKLHSAEVALDPSAWARALDVVSAQTLAHGAILLTSPGDGLTNVPSTASLAASNDSYFRDGWHLRDERSKCIPTLRRNGVADDFDAIGHEHIRRHPYYQEFLAPHELRWFVAVKVSCGEKLWILSIQRSIQQDPFSPEEKERLIRLTHSLPASIAIGQALGAASGSSALDSFEFNQTAAVLIDRRGNVIRPNPRRPNGCCAATSASAPAGL